MGKWYLSRKEPDITSLLTNDDISNYAESNFTDVLMTDYANSVDLYDHALNKLGTVRCIMQGYGHTTYITSMERTALFKIGTTLGGMYVRYEDNWWLITGRPGNNKAYEKAVLVMCQYDLKWQLDNGDIVHRPCHISSASKYDIGLERNDLMILPSNNYIVLVSCDDETNQLEGKRVIIDHDPNKDPIKVFLFTRNDDVLFQYGSHGGVLSYIVDRDLFNTETDNKELGICDYVDPNKLPHESDDITVDNLTAKITGRTSIKIGYPRKYIVTFTNSSGNEYTGDDVNFEWKVTCDYNIVTSVDGKTLTVAVDDTNSIGSMITIQVYLNGSVADELHVVIEKGY